MGIGYHYLGGFDAQARGQLFPFTLNEVRSHSETHRRVERGLLE